MLRRRFIVVCSREDAPSATPAGGTQTAETYLSELCGSLCDYGQEVEVWTVHRDGQAVTESASPGFAVRRFPGQRDHLVPRLRPCWWVSEWVAGATSYLADSLNDNDEGIAPTIVTFRWEAGIAGRLLAERFDLDLLHVPLPTGIAISDARPSGRIGRHDEEDRETCRQASLVIAATPQVRETVLQHRAASADADSRVTLLPAGPDMGQRLLSLLPPPARPAVAICTAAAEPGEQDETLPFPVVRDDSATASRRPRHLRWRFELELAKYALLGGRTSF